MIAPATKKSGLFYGYVIVAASFFILIATFGPYYAFGVFFTPVLTEFGWTRALTSGAFSLSMIVHGLLGIASGGLTDRFGPRLVMAVSGIFLALGYLLMSQVSNIWQLYLFYGVIVGTGMSAAWVSLLSTVARWFVARRNMMTGIVLAGTGIGALVAPPIASRLISVYDWRTSYIIMGVFVLVVVVLLAMLLKRDPFQVGQSPYGEKAREDKGQKVPVEGLSLRDAVHTRHLWIICGMFICFGAAMFSLMVHIVPHSIELNIPATSAANTLATIGGVSILGRLLGGAADRIGNRNVFVIGFAVMSAILFWLAFARAEWMLYVIAMVFGVVQGAMGVSESPLVARIFGMRSHGVIFGVTGFAFTVGGAIGPSLTGYIFDATRSYQLAFLVSGATAALGLVLSLVLKPVRWGNSAN